VLGRKEATTLHLDLWLMSCRVLKRDMEVAMLDAVIERAQAEGVTTLVGYYFATKKNGMVADHYEKLGFTLQPSDTGSDNAPIYTLSLAGYVPRNRHIKNSHTKDTELVHG
jgi:predicted enzyme involved in methoxymalonyl-ACP biosynthesis